MRGPVHAATRSALGVPLAVSSMTSNHDYLVPYRTAFLLCITVRVAVTWPAFTIGTMICKVFCDDPIRERLKAASVYCDSSQCSKHSSKAVHRFGLWSPPAQVGDGVEGSSKREALTPRLSRAIGAGLKPTVRQGSTVQDDTLSRARSSGRGTARRKKRSAEYP